MDANIEHSDRECDEVGIDNSIECDETIEQPTVGMNFSSVEEVLSYYMKYGKQKGFGMCKRNSRQDDNGNIRWICLACVRGGTSKSKAVNVMKPRQIEKIGCMAKINVILNNEGGYTLSKVILDHTYVCSLGKARHFRCFKKVDPQVAKRLEINDEAGIWLSKNFKIVVVEAWGEPEFESQWRDMLDTYDLHENAWLVSLYSDRPFWVPGYVKDTFWAGMSSTQRSESMNAFFDDYVNSKTTMKQFVDQYDSTIRRKVQYPGAPDPVTSMGGTTVDPATSMAGTTVDPATSMGGMTDRVLSPLVV
ncbi:uncharacterized protein LOC121260246 [Juglans microcarpa x Juglans regia]|uniref:uncharacterized protein LOC121260246 n=1 Tax=Juglans microcarpa x Juglans regia TaxID=2249226 RepID=UPI001B7DBCBA|nr:uncharacterized protein LOC121260246 [Juglans microcarpa x Juglans regia]